jgi:hypothetical protein
MVERHWHCGKSTPCRIGMAYSGRQRDGGRWEAL